jgi:hypothetical protein
MNYTEQQNKELIEENEKLMQSNSERQLKIEQLIDKLKIKETGKSGSTTKDPQK